MPTKPVRTLPELLPATLLAPLEACFPALRARGDGLFAQLVTGPAQRLAHLCQELPASEHHHDAGDGGLLRHSLQVAVAAVAQIDAQQPGLVAAEGIEQQKALRERQRLAACYAGMAHDMGKLLQLQVYITDAHGTARPGLDGGVQRAWTPELRTLTAQAQRYGGDHYTYVWRPGRSPRGWYDHEPLSVLLLDVLLTPSVLRVLGTQGINMVVHALTASTAAAQHAAPMPVRAALTQADRQVTAQALPAEGDGALPAEGPPVIGVMAPSGAGLELGRHLATDTILALRAVWERRAELGLVANAVDGHFLVGETFTAVVLAGVGERKTKVLQAAATRLLELLTAAGHGVGRLAGIADAEAVLGPELALRFAADRLPLVAVVPDMAEVRNPGARRAVPTIRHYLSLRLHADGQEYHRLVWLIANRLLWTGVADAPPAWDALVRLRAADRRSPGWPAEALGFRAYAGRDRAAVRQLQLQRAAEHTRDPQVAAAVQAAVAEEQDLSLDFSPATLGVVEHPPVTVSALRLWGLLHQVAPLPAGDEPLQQVWRDLDRELAIRQVLAPEQVELVLHHLVGRLSGSVRAWQAAAVQVQDLLERPRAVDAAEPHAVAEARSDRARYLATLADDEVPPVRDIADRLRALTLLAVGERVRLPTQHDDPLGFVMDDRLGLVWPEGIGHYLAVNAQQRSVLTVAADFLRRDLLDALQECVVTTRAGTGIHFVRVAHHRYRGTRHHHRLLVLDARHIRDRDRLPLPDRLPGAIITSPWASLT
jgi:hypothetical protein